MTSVCADAREVMKQGTDHASIAENRSMEGRLCYKENPGSYSY